MGVNLCTCKDYNKIVFQQKTDYIFQNNNNNYLGNFQQASEVNINSKEEQPIKPVNLNNNNNINDNDKNKNGTNNSGSNNESVEENENDEENGNNQNDNVKIDIVEELPEEEEKSRSINDMKSKGLKKESDSFKLRSLEFTEQDFEQKMKKYGDYVEDNIIEERTSQQIKYIEKKLGEFYHEKKETNNEIFTRSAILFKANKIIYKGDWNKSGIKEGFGICIDSDGNKYIGYWKNNVFDGKGRLISINGDYYEGEFLDGNIEGEGKFYNNKEKYTYIGKFKNNKFDGEGEIKYENNGNFDVNYYKGFFKNGLREGEGKIEYNNGKFYQGEFKNNCFDGEGTFDFQNGNVYKGHWEKNCIDGNGEFIWGNGDKYKGTYKNFEKNGNGDYFSDKNYYKGNWLMGFPHGKGKVSNNGNKISGYFRFGKMVKTTGKRESFSKSMSTDKKSNDESEEDKNVKKQKSRKGKRGKSYKESSKKNKDKNKKAGSPDKK